MKYLKFIFLVLLCSKFCSSANILMATLGGSKSHKIPFWELARGLAPRGHNITFISGYPADFHIQGMEEITPLSLVFYIRNFTNWDLLGVRMKGVDTAYVVDPLEVVRYAHESCEILFSDPETQDFLRSRQTYDLIILDGAYPECCLGLAKHFNAPFMYINTVAFYTGSLSLAGNPAPFSVTPIFLKGLTDNMSLVQRMLNTGYNIMMNMVQKYTIQIKIDSILKRYFGPDILPAYEMARNVSFILQNGHATVTYPRAYLPNVAEIACIHCKAAKPLPKDLEDFINDGGESGFIYISMGSAVKAVNMPEQLRRLLIKVFEQLPYKVLWKWESEVADLPENVKTGKWLPQQDLLGHKKIRAFITHGGLLSMFETVYHGVPVISMPVFCDHAANAEKAELDGYAIKLELSSITVESLLAAIKKVIHDPKYKNEVRKRQFLLKDQKETPLERAIYWTEYVLRHKGAPHLQSPSRNMSWIQYYLVDVFTIYILCILLMYFVCKHTIHFLSSKSYFSLHTLNKKQKVA